MNCEKLYYNDSFACRFEATVTDCFECKNGYAVILDRTLFYPEGGGQPCDKGSLCWSQGQTEIFDVREKDDCIYHYAKSSIPTGTKVCGEIDFERRFDLMQQHTGEHIVSGIVHSLFGYDNVGFHLTEKDMSLDFSGVLSSEDIQRVISAANDIIIKNQPIVADYPDVSNLEYRSKKALNGPIRIVRAGSADICACCGTHLKTTGQVQMIAVKDSMKYKGGTRIFLGCGKRVYADYCAKTQQCLDISHSLSAKTDEISSRVRDKISECENLKISLSALKDELFDCWVSAISCKSTGFISKDGLNGSELQRLCAKISEKCPTACAVSRQSDGTGKFCIFSSVLDTNAVGKTICQKLNGKGGGKPGTFQGTFTVIENAEQILEAALNAE